MNLNTWRNMSEPEQTDRLNCHVKCKHEKTTRVEKLNGIQPTEDENFQFILVNCDQCGTTLTGADIINGVVKNIREGSNITGLTPNSKPWVKV